MDTFIQYLIPIIALGLLAAGWMGMQLWAKRNEVKNHIDHQGGCCGACSNRDQCERVLPQ
ncbi:MAG: hypothetical protein KDC57_02205 [Saprospiraceae bacterium]|nr:hypothetical protein [Saprospiraceae bacterium]